MKAGKIYTITVISDMERDEWEDIRHVFKMMAVAGERDETVLQQAEMISFEQVFDQVNLDQFECQTVVEVDGKTFTAAPSTEELLNLVSQVDEVLDFQS